MNKKKNHAEFAASLDRRLSGLQGDPWLAQRIIASEKGDFKVKKISRATIIFAALIVLTMATALAAGLGGRVNWLGDTKTRSELEPSATPMPMPVPETSKSADGIDPSYYDLLDYSKDREQIVISTENGGASSARIQTIKSIDEFNTLVNTGSGLPLPEKMPDGYVFEKGFAELGCLPEGHYVLTSETIHPEGFTETHYTVDPSMDFVRAYTLIFRKQSDNGNHADHVQVNVQMTTYTNPNDYTYGISETETAQVVQVEDMDNALLITSKDRKLLVMRKMMSAPQYDLLLLPDNELMTETYCEYRIEVSGNQLTSDELIRVFTK